MEGLKKILLGFLKGIGRTISYLLAIVIIGVLVAANLVTPRYQALISNFLGHTSSQIEDTAKNSESTDYFTSDFSSEEEWKKAGQDLAQEVEEEGIVLLRNQSSDHYKFLCSLVVNKFPLYSLVKSAISLVHLPLFRRKWRFERLSLLPLGLCSSASCQLHCTKEVGLWSRK